VKNTLPGESDLKVNMMDPAFPPLAASFSTKAKASKLFIPEATPAGIT